MNIDRFFPNIMSTDIKKTRDVLCDLLELEVEYESAWFIHLKSPKRANLELGILPVKSEIIPNEFQSHSCGVMLTYTVEDVEPVFKKAKKNKLKVLEPPTDQFYGQRRLLLLEEKSGVLIDLSSECEPSEEFMNNFN